MSGNYLKEDLRVIKTQRALKASLLCLLESKNFKRITVNDICAQALTSRAAFYSHYNDKYLLLEATFDELVKERLTMDDIQELIGGYIYEKNKVVRNIVCDADAETLDIMLRFTYNVVEHAMGDVDKSKPEYIVLSNFCLGGIVQIVKWQIQNSYPQHLEQSKKYLQELIVLLSSHKF